MDAHGRIRWVLPEYPAPMRIAHRLDIRLYPANADSQSEDTKVLTMNY